MHFTTSILAALIAVAMAAPAPDAQLSYHAALVRRLAAMNDADTGIEKRCNRKGYAKCADPCKAFNNGPSGGISWALCLASCNKIYRGNC
ncbi:hypothetical protein P171DRAFT_479298 [Karstenula rhodostoma CBS 690.94]|uniref:Invertebrate defensins family profile domain-containing protein n=1 Tax=Karstenula rhodostoma CBS 690.94 TaxID=1392251 RepID=A0A9P4PRW5_9PLEO|nr:hypothetical protein P171DRAFT_479298 [Karstenula rhodostoma CBS 690.94]